MKELIDSIEKKKIRLDLTEAESQKAENRLDRINMCKQACRDIVHEVVVNYEDSLIQQNLFWQVLHEKTGLSRHEYGIGKDADGFYAQSRADLEFLDIVKKCENDPELKENIRNAVFGEKKEE